MKRTFIHSGTTIIALLLLLGACKKNTFNVTKRDYPDGNALVKIGLFSAFGSTTNMLIYLNEQRVSGAIAPPYPFPGGGLNTSGSANGDYFIVKPGATKIELFLPNPGTDIAFAKFYETTQNMEANKKYTIYITDTGANTTAITVNDEAVAPDSGFARIRFINLMPNAGAVDFYKGNTILKNNIGYKEFTEFFDVPFGADSFSIRPAGAPPGSASSGTAFRVIETKNKRVYSFLSRGYVGATGARLPNVSAIVNQ